MNIQKYLHLWLHSLVLSVALVTERKRDLLGVLEHIVAVCGYKSFQTRSYIKRPRLLGSDVINMSRTWDKEKPESKTGIETTTFPTLVGCSNH